MVKITSSTSGKVYTVTRTICTCGDYQFRQKKVGGICNHMRRLFYTNKESNSEDSILELFREGANPELAIKQYGDNKIQMWLSTGNIYYNKKDRKSVV